MNKGISSLLSFFILTVLCNCYESSDLCLSAELPSIHGQPNSEVVVEKSNNQIRIAVYPKEGNDISYCSLHQYETNEYQNSISSLKENFAYFGNSEFFRAHQKKSKTDCHGSYSFWGGKFYSLADDHQLRQMLLSLPLESTESSKCHPHPLCNPKKEELSPELIELGNQLLSFKHRSSEQTNSPILLKGGRNIQSDQQPLYNSYEDLYVIYYVENIFVYSGAGNDTILTAATWLGPGLVTSIQIVHNQGLTRPSAIILRRKNDTPGSYAASFLFNLQHASNGYTFRIQPKKFTDEPSVIMRFPGSNRGGVDIFSLTNITNVEAILNLRNTELDDVFWTLNISTIVLEYSNNTMYESIRAAFRFNYLIISAVWQLPYVQKNFYYSLSSYEVVRITNSLPPITADDPKVRKEYLYSYSATEFVFINSSQLSHIRLSSLDWATAYNYQSAWNISLPTSLTGLKTVVPLPTEEREQLRTMNGNLPSGQTEIESFVFFGLYKPDLPTQIPDFICDWRIFNKDYTNVFFFIGSVVYGPKLDWNTSSPIPAPTVYQIYPLGNCFIFPMADGEMEVNFTSHVFYSSGFRISKSLFNDYQIKIPLKALDKKTNVSLVLDETPPVVTPSAFAPTPAPPPVTLPPTAIPPSTYYTFTPPPVPSPTGDANQNSFHFIVTILAVLITYVAY